MTHPDASLPDVIKSVLALAHRMVEGKSVNDILDHVPALVRRIIPSAGCLLRLYDAETQSLYFYEAHGHVGGSQRGEFCPLSRGLEGMVARQHKGVLLNTPREHPQFEDTFPPAEWTAIHSLMIAPIVFGEDFYGTLKIINSEHKEFTPVDMNSLLLVCDILAGSFHAEELREKELEEHRMATIGYAVSSIIHDVKNPLTSIKGFGQLLAKKSPDNERYCSFIAHEVNQLLDMLQEWLDYARGQTLLHLETVNADAYLRQFVENVRPILAESRVDLQLSLRCPFDVQIDQNKFARALYNLITNAVKFLKDDPRIIRVTTQQVGDGWQLEISDSGRGISRENQERLFKPYFSTDTRQGTGLGLVSVKNIVEAHHGVITFCSREGEGTTFQLTMPHHPVVEKPGPT